MLKTGLFVSIGLISLYACNAGTVGSGDHDDAASNDVATDTALHDDVRTDTAPSQPTPDVQTAVDATIVQVEDAQLDAPNRSCRTPDGSEIVAGQSVTIGCQLCTCQATGSFICSTLGCSDASIVPQRDADVQCIGPDGQIWSVGAMFIDGCLECNCANNGTIQCTDLECRDGSVPVSDGGTPYCDDGRGNRIPIGSQINIGCDRCLCERGGSLLCSQTGCSDAGDPPFQCFDGQGRPIGVGESFDDGCNRCVCLDNGNLSCTHFVCDADGGVVVPPPQICNALTVDEAPTPIFALSNGAAPPAVGGAIADGRYVMTSVTYYGLARPPSNFGRAVMVIAGATGQLVVEEPDTHQLTTESFNITTSANRWMVQATCPPLGAGETTYTATPTQIVLLTEGPASSALVFTRQ